MSGLIAHTVAGWMIAGFTAGAVMAVVLGGRGALQARRHRHQGDRVRFVREDPTRWSR